MNGKPTNEKKSSDNGWDNLTAIAPVSNGRTMSCKLEGMSLLTLLRILGDSHKTGVIAVQSGTQSGRIFIRNGHVCYASLDNVPAAFPPRKSLHRILAWTSGSFDLQWIDPGIHDDELLEEVDALLRETMRQREVLQEVPQKVPPPETRLTVCLQPPAQIKNLLPDELVIFQSALQGETVQGVLDSHPSTDVEVYSLLANLMNSGLICESKYPEPAPESDESVPAVQGEVPVAA